MTETFFGDFDVEDAYDTEPADPEQVARKLHSYRVLIEQLAGNEIAPYDELARRDLDDINFVGEAIVEFVGDHEPNDEGLAQAIHEAGRERRIGDDEWDDLPDDHKRFAVAIARLIGAWLIRQGAWQ